MSINIVYVCSKLYPGQQKLGNIKFGQPEDKILITQWSVPNIKEPTVEYLESLFSEYQRQFDIDEVSNIAAYKIQAIIDSTAQFKGYGDCVSCLTYINSSVILWKNEAIAISEWRDSCWKYAYNLLDIAQRGGAIPAIDEIINGLPIIVWP